MQEEGKDIAIIKIEVNDAPALKLGDASEVEIQDDILSLGYPMGADIVSYKKKLRGDPQLNLEIEDLLDFFPANEASVNKGKVANPNKRLPDNSPVLQLDVSVSSGSSGGPVLNDQGDVIGMIAFSSANYAGESSVPFAVTINTIKEYTGDAGATNEQGVTVDLFRKGLALYWQQDYEGAKVKFKAVKNLFPQHSEVDRLIRDCNQAIAEQWRRNYLPWIAIGGLAAAVLVLSYLLLKRKSVPGELVGAGVSVPEAMPEAAEHKGWQSVSRLVTGIFQPSTVMDTNPFLELQNAQGQVQRAYLKQARHQLGRDLEWADINIPEEVWEVISRRHAVLEKEGDDYRIYNSDRIAATTNGISVNGKRISPEEGYLLNDGDQLKIGLDPHNQITLTYFHPMHSRPAPTPSQANAQSGFRETDHAR